MTMAVETAVRHVSASPRRTRWASRHVLGITNTIVALLSTSHPWSAHGFVARTTTKTRLLIVARGYPSSSQSKRRFDESRRQQRIHLGSQLLATLPETADTSPAASSRSSSFHHRRQDKDWWTLSGYAVGCFATAFIACTYEDYECSHLKTTLRPNAVRGMGFGQAERLRNQFYEDTVTSRQIPSYNEIMWQHRTSRVPMWNRNEQSVQAQETQAINHVKEALETTFQLQRLAADYAWDDMRLLLRQPVLTTQLDEACAFLRRHPPPTSTTQLSASEVSSEIGFEWGSCAWRHCGAHADVQEATAELYNLLGVLEPYECLFVLDIVERSLRDILAACDAHMELPVYHVYQSVGEALGDGEGRGSLDLDFLDVLKGLRNNLD